MMYRVVCCMFREESKEFNKLYRNNKENRVGEYRKAENEQDGEKNPHRLTTLML